MLLLFPLGGEIKAQGVSVPALERERTGGTGAGARLQASAPAPCLIKIRGFVLPCLVTLADCEGSV